MAHGWHKVAEGCEVCDRRRESQRRRYAANPGYYISRRATQQSEPLTERTCKTCGESFMPIQATQVYCRPEHRAKYLRPFTPHIASASARGYGAEHQRERERWKPLVEMGLAVCTICAKPISPDQRWHLDHTPDRTAYRGAAHASCNTRDGAIRGNKNRTKPRPEIVRECATCGAEFTTIYPRQVYCTEAHRPSANRNWSL